jgi:acyl-CoA reductase-like NAD-dependent aldehyde dehydrogenase
MLVPYPKAVAKPSLANIELPEYVTHEDEEVKVITKYYPLGVVAGICPWNFPVPTRFRQGRRRGHDG